MTMSAPWTRVNFGGANQPKGPGERSRTMIIIGADYHPGFQQVAYVDTDTGELQERRLEHREDADFELTRKGERDAQSITRCLTSHHADVQHVSRANRTLSLARNRT